MGEWSPPPLPIGSLLATVGLVAHKIAHAAEIVPPPSAVRAETRGAAGSSATGSDVA